MESSGQGPWGGLVYEASLRCLGHTFLILQEDGEGLLVWWLAGFQERGSRSLCGGTDLGSALAHTLLSCIQLVKTSHQASFKGRAQDPTS